MLSPTNNKLFNTSATNLHSGQVNLQNLGPNSEEQKDPKTTMFCTFRAEQYNINLSFDSNGMS